MTSSNYTFRAMFYLLAPSETYFDKLEDVPPVIIRAGPFFILFIIIENIIAFVRTGKKCIRLNDGIASAGSGVLSRMPDVFMQPIQFVTYSWVYDNFKIYTLQWNSFLTYLITLLAVDFCFYWFHRMAHEINILWAAHQAHHSSEEYNLTTALRKSVIQPFTSWIFFIPLALFIPPPVFAIHIYVNLLSQFWIHTEIVERLGFLEYFLNTPSHHRVHHGRNPYCIDKNYGGVLIIWDKIFGTFEAEKTNEKIAYGLVHNIETFDPFYIELFYYKYIVKTFFEINGLKNKMKFLFYGPGYQPGLARLGDPNTIPKVETPIKIYDPQVSISMQFYILVHYLLNNLIILEILNHNEKYNTLNLVMFCSCFTLGLYSFSRLFESKY